MSGLRAAAENVVAEWDRYIEAHAGRGHEGPHDEERALGGGCGLCAGAMYGTEVTMGEYAISNLRAALSSPSSEGRRLSKDEPLDVERLARAMHGAMCGPNGHPWEYDRPIAGNVAYLYDTAALSKETPA